VERTPELLPVLKQAGVVDSGGKGLFFIFEECCATLTVSRWYVPIASVRPLSAMNLENAIEISSRARISSSRGFRAHRELNLHNFYAELETMGTSIQVGEGEGNVPDAHPRSTENRNKPVDYIMGLGTITKIGHGKPDRPDGRYFQKNCRGAYRFGKRGTRTDCVVTVSPGRGISRVFASLGVAGIVEGGQTMTLPRRIFLEPLRICRPIKSSFCPITRTSSWRATSQGCTVKATCALFQPYHSAGIGSYDAT